MIWKTYKVHHRVFEVSQKGKIRNEDGVMLKGTLHKNGFRVINLKIKMPSGSVLNYSMIIHRVVAKCFIENTDCKPFVIHKDGNMLNNKIENLQWATSKEKLSHQKSIGKFGNAKLTTLDVLKIKKRISKGDVIQQIANDFNVSHTQIHRIKRGENWQNNLLPLS